MDSYLLTSTRTPCPRPLRPVPAPFPPPPALSGRDPRLHLVALGIPPPPLLLLPGAIPLRSVDARTQREMVLLFHGGRFASPSQSGGGAEGTEPSLCSLGAWRCTAPHPGVRSHVPSSGLPGDAPVPIAPAGHCATLLLCPLTLQELGKRGWSWAGGHPLLYPDIPHSSIPTQTAAPASPAEPSLF